MKKKDERDVNAQAEAVFELWRSYQRAPERCSFTDTRKKLLYARLRSQTGETLCALMRYAFESETPEARFWRGGNAEQREYLDLENLLRVKTLDDRVERALAWMAGEDPHDPEGPQDDTDTDDDGDPEYDARLDRTPVRSPPPVHGHSLRRPRGEAPAAPAPAPAPPPAPPPARPPELQPVRGHSLRRPSRS